jgi:hypothetical protein
VIGAYREDKVQRALHIRMLSTPTRARRAATRPCWLRAGAAPIARPATIRRPAFVTAGGWCRTRGDRARQSAATIDCMRAIGVVGRVSAVLNRLQAGNRWARSRCQHSRCATSSNVACSARLTTSRPR